MNTASTSFQQRPLSHQRLAIASLSLATVLLSMDASIANIALPEIARAMHIDSSTSILLVATYNLVLAMTLLPFAALGERIGLNRMFRSGLALYLLGSALTYVATSFTQLVALRGLQALSASASLSVSIALVRASYPPHKLGRGLGLNTVAGVTGAALGPTIGGLVLSLFSWKWIFIAGIPLAALSLICSRTLPTMEPHNEPLDSIGAVLCAVTFGLVISGLESLGRHTSLLISGSLIGGGILAALVFVRYEIGQNRPILPVDLLARPALALSVGAALSAVLGSTILLLAMPFRLHAYGFGAAEIGAMMLPYVLVIGIAAPTGGMLSDRFSPTIIGTAGLIAAVLGMLTLAFIPSEPQAADIYWRMALNGLGFGMFFSPNARLIVGSAPRDRAAPASSLVATTRMFGQAAGSTLLGILLGIGWGGRASAVVAACLTIVAGICSAARLYTKVEQSQAR